MKILIADDNSDDRKLLRYIIERQGYEVIEAEDGQKGLEMAAAHRPDMIVSDALMPVMDGFQFLRNIKTNEILKSIPFIFYSATYKGYLDVQLAMSLGAEAYIIKPKDPLELWKEIEIIIKEGKREKVVSAELVEEDEEYLRKYSQVVAIKLEGKIKELEKSEKFLNEIFNSIQDGISVLDKDLNIVKVNVMMEKWYAHQMPLPGKRCYEAYHGRTMPCEVCPTRRALQSGNPEFDVVPLTGPKGEIKGWLELFSFPLIDLKTNELTGVIEYVRDVTERKKVEKEINLLASIVKSIPEAVCSIDLNGNIVSWNEGAEKMLGYKKEEIIGKHITVTIPDELAQKELEHCIGTLNAEGFFRGYESVRLAKDGRIVPVEITAVALKDDKQNIVSYTSIMRDITERKQAEEEIKRRIKELEDFYHMAVGRELRMKALKEEIEKLNVELERYRNVYNRK